MYLPIFRGRLFELIALRECVEQDLLSSKIIPVVEPVKATSTFIKTLETFVKKRHKIAVIENPIVGSWLKDIVKGDNTDICTKMEDLKRSRLIIPSFYVAKSWDDDIVRDLNKSIMICKNEENIPVYEKVVGSEKPMYSLIPDKGNFRRRIRANRVICEDHFPKQARNVDYVGIDDEFFSSDHRYYADDGYKGFSDYSVIGEEYNEIGFAPRAVAIHIVYFDDNDNLRIAHFVSDSNDNIKDPAGKFEEAAEKLMKWNRRKKLNTVGIKALKEALENNLYPGLGMIKKYSIMHHLELMKQYLNGEVQ